MIFTSEKTKKIFSLDYDEFGDSYTKEIDAKNLQEIFRNMESKVCFLQCNVLEKVFPRNSKPVKMARLQYDNALWMVSFLSVIWKICRTKKDTQWIAAGFLKL